MINKLPPFVKQITNDQRKQKPGVKVSPVGGGADAATAEIFEGIIRHIEYESQADVAYDTGFDYAVSSSFGYWRYITVYCDDRSTEQDIRVARITDPQTRHARLRRAGARQVGCDVGLRLHAHVEGRVQAPV